MLWGYNWLNVRYNSGFGLVDKTAKCKFRVIYNNERLFGDDFNNNIFAFKINTKLVVQDVRGEFYVDWSR